MLAIVRPFLRLSVLTCALVAPALAQSPAAEPVPADAPGRLEVSADEEGAEVLLDGEAIGRAPLVRDGVMPGMHTVVVTLGARTLTRSVSVPAGASLHLAVTLPPAAPAAAPPRPLPTAFNELGQSIIDLPWAALAVGVTFGLVLTSVVMLTTTPADIPLLADTGVEVPRNAWRGAAIGAGLSACIVGAVALVLLAVRLEPVEKLIGVIRAAQGTRR